MNSASTILILRQSHTSSRTKWHVFREPKAAEAIVCVDGSSAATREVSFILHQPKLWPAAPIGPAKAMLLPEANVAADAGRDAPEWTAADDAIDAIAAQAGSTADCHSFNSGSNHDSMHCDVEPLREAAAEAGVSASPCPQASAAADPSAALPSEHASNSTHDSSGGPLSSLHQQQQQQQAMGNQKCRVLWIWLHAAAYQESYSALHAAAVASTAAELPSSIYQVPNYAAKSAHIAQLPMNTAAASDLPDVPTAMEMSDPTVAKRPSLSDAEPRPLSPVAAMDITYPIAPPHLASQPDDVTPPPLPMPHSPSSPVAEQVPCQPITASQLPSSSTAARAPSPAKTRSPPVQGAASVLSEENAAAGSPGPHTEASERRICPGVEGHATPACGSPEVAVLLQPLHDRLRRLELRGPSTPALLASLLLPDLPLSQPKAAPLLRATAPTGSAVAHMARDRRLIMGTDSTPASAPQQQTSPAAVTTMVAGDISRAHLGVPQEQSRHATADVANRGDAFEAGFTEATAWQLLQQERTHPFPFSQQEVTLVFALTSQLLQIN